MAISGRGVWEEERVELENWMRATTLMLTMAIDLEEPALAAFWESEQREAMRMLDRYWPSQGYKFALPY